MLKNVKYEYNYFSIALQYYKRHYAFPFNVENTLYKRARQKSNFIFLDLCNSFIVSYIDSNLFYYSKGDHSKDY